MNFGIIPYKITLRGAKTIHLLLFGAFMYSFWGILHYEHIVRWLHIEHVASPIIGLTAASSGVLALLTVSRFFHLPSSWHGQTRLIIFLLLSVAACIVTSPREEELLELKMQRLLLLGQPQAAIEASSRYHAPTAAILHLRIEALSATGELCNDFFTYPLGHTLKGGTDITTIVGTDDSGSQSAFHRQSLVFLLKRDLPSLSRHLAGVPPTRLQRAELEALVLYAHQHSTSQHIVRDRNIEANYLDFRSLESKQMHLPFVSRANILGDTYGDTYWHYYYYGKY